MRFISKQARNVAKLMTVQSPHLLLSGLAKGMADDSGCLIKHFHFLSVWGFAKTANYANAIASGAFSFCRRAGFDVIGDVA